MSKPKKKPKTIKRYSWSSTAAKYGVDPEAAAIAFEEIRQQFGYLRPNTLVEAAQNQDHVLHGCFPWDDEEAARIGRERIAADLIRSLRVTVEVIPGQIIKVRGAVLTPDINAPCERSYQDTVSAMSEPDSRAFVLKQAWLQLAAWKRKYGNLTELAEALPLIEEALSRFAS